MTKEKKYQVEFTQECLEDIRKATEGMTPEELEEFENFMTTVIKALESGQPPEGSQVVDMDELQEEDPELYERLVSRTDTIPGKN